MVIKWHLIPAINMQVPGVCAVDGDGRQMCADDHVHFLLYMKICTN